MAQKEQQWKKAGLKDAVSKTVTNTLVMNYKKSKKTPDDFFKALLENNTTHFTNDELERLLAVQARYGRSFVSEPLLRGGGGGDGLDESAPPQATVPRVRF